MTEIVVSYSELDTFRQCPLKHHWAYKERWRKPITESSALAKGSLMHLVYETHYQVLQQHDRLTKESQAQALAEAAAAVRPILFDDRTGEQTETQELVYWIYKGYVQRWGAEPEFEIEGVEEAFRINLNDPEGKPSRFILKGKIDLIVRDRSNGQLWVIDHKSGANLPSQLDLEIDDQFGLYVWAMRESGSPVLGAVHSASRTTRNVADYPGYIGKSQPQSLDQRFSRTYLNRSEAELSSIALDAWAAAVNAYPDHDMPLYSSPDPRNCGWKCDFKEIHLLARKGRDPRQALEDYGFFQDFTRH
jgi:hypothetical protein